MFENILLGFLVLPAAEHITSAFYISDGNRCRILWSIGQPESERSCKRTSVTPICWTHSSKLDCIFMVYHFKIIYGTIEQLLSCMIFWSFFLFLSNSWVKTAPIIMVGALKKRMFSIGHCPKKGKGRPLPKFGCLFSPRERKLFLCFFSFL